MPLENPIPRACVLLLLALPLLLAAGHALAVGASADRGTQRVLAAPVALAMWLVSVCSIARLTHAFVPGLVGGTLLVAALGARHGRALWRGYWKERPGVPWRAVYPRLLFAAFAVAVIVPAALKFFHDETVPTGHLSTVCQLQNGHYPPRYSFFPQFEFKYHYGFDVFAAMLSGLLHSSASTAIDVATLLLWGITALLAAHLGQRLAGERHGLVTAAFALFGGGFLFFCPGPTAPLGQQLTGHCVVDGFKVNAPVSSYFFQHPFGLGIPLALAVLCLLVDRESGARRGRYLAFGVLLLALYLGQIVLFLTFVAALAVSEVFVGWRPEWSRALLIAPTLALVFACATQLGAFGAAKAPYQLGTLLQPHLGIANSLGGTLEWHWRTYGIILPLGLVGLVALRRERLMFALLITGCLLVSNLVRYKLTWDIVKFATEAQFLLSICAGVVVARLFQARRKLPLAARPGMRGLALLLLCAGTTAGLGFHLAIWRKMSLKPNLEMAPGTLGEADTTVLNYLRRHVGAEEIVYRRYDVSFVYNQLGGLNIPWLLSEDNHGFGPKHRDPRSKVMNTVTPRIADYLAQGITWFVLDGNDQALLQHARRWVKSGEAEQTMEEGGLKVFHALKK
jgi:hypothetical protein